MVRKARRSVPVEDEAPVAVPETVVEPVVDDDAEETSLAPPEFDLKDLARRAPDEVKVEPVRVVEKVVEPVVRESVPAPRTQFSFTEVDAKKGDTAKAKVLAKIARYREQFDILRDYPVNEFDSAEGLETQLNTMKMKIHSKKGVLFLKSVYMAGVGGWEFINTKANTLQLGGLTQMMGQSPDVDLLLREIQAEYGFGSGLRPEFKLCMLTLQTSVMVDTFNRQKLKYKDKLDGEVKTELVSEFKDL